MFLLSVSPTHSRRTRCCSQPGTAVPMHGPKLMSSVVAREMQECSRSDRGSGKLQVTGSTAGTAISVRARTGSDRRERGRGVFLKAPGSGRIPAGKSPNRVYGARSPWSASIPFGMGPRRSIGLPAHANQLLSPKQIKKKICTPEPPRCVQGLCRSKRSALSQRTSADKLTSLSLGRVCLPAFNLSFFRFPPAQHRETSTGGVNEEGRRVIEGKLGGPRRQGRELGRSGALFREGSHAIGGDKLGGADRVD